MMQELHNRKIVQTILPLLETNDIIVIHGARQVGKSSLLNYLIKYHIKSDYFYMDLENLEYLNVCNNGSKAICDFLEGKGFTPAKKMFLFIDEIQYLDNPSNLLKILHDHHPTIKLVVSGSSSFDIKKKFKESLVGRTINFELYPLDFEEFLTFKNAHYVMKEDNSPQINNELVRLFEEYNFYGGYPKIVLENNIENKKLMLSQIIQTYIKKDIRDVGNIRDLHSFNKVVEVLAAQSGNLLNVEELSNTLQVDKSTIKNWIFLLEATYILKIVRPFHRNLRSELIKNPKVFFIDTGLMHLLSLKTFPKVITGSSFETSFFSELLKNRHAMNFWRTTNKQEIDFILKTQKELLAIETKLNFQQTINKSFFFFKEKYTSKNIIISLYGNKDTPEKKYPWEAMKELEHYKENYSEDKTKNLPN